MDKPFVPIAPRSAPPQVVGLAPWLRNNLFSSVPNALVTVLMLAVLVWAAKAGIEWGVVHAVTAADADACQAARGIGACWGVVHEKARFILLGRYPQTEHWRPEAATFLLLGLVVASCSRWFWKPWLALLWLLVLAVFFTLMGGGAFGLALVPTDQWGGLPLTAPSTASSAAGRPTGRSALGRGRTRRRPSA